MPRGACKVGGKHLKYYRVWVSMLRRCYSEKYHLSMPTYIGCSVCDEWKTLSVFKKWHDANYVKGFHLDKDLLVEGNKVYSPETCIYASPTINVLLTDHRRARGKYPQGVIIDHNHGFCTV